LPFTISANFGTIIIASLFGGKVEQRGEKPLWVLPFNLVEEFNSIFDRDPLDFSQGICPQVIARYKFYFDVFEDWSMNVIFLFIHGSEPYGTPSEGMIYLFYESNGGAKMARFNLAWVTDGKDWKTFIEN